MMDEACFFPESLNFCCKSLSPIINFAVEFKPPCVCYCASHQSHGSLPAPVALQLGEKKKEHEEAKGERKE